jgi:hypothetical protein
LLIEISNGSQRQGLQEWSRSRNWPRNSRIIPEMEMDFERTNEESWLQWKLRHGYEFGPINVGGKRSRSIFELTAGPRHQKQNTQCKGANRVHSATDCTIFELAIRAFDIQIGWKDAFERQRE